MRSRIVAVFAGALLVAGLIAGPVTTSRAGAEPQPKAKQFSAGFSGVQLDNMECDASGNPTAFLTTSEFTVRGAKILGVGTFQTSFAPFQSSGWTFTAQGGQSTLQGYNYPSSVDNEYIYVKLVVESGTGKFAKATYGEIIVPVPNRNGPGGFPRCGIFEYVNQGTLSGTLNYG